MNEQNKQLAKQAGFIVDNNKIITMKQDNTIEFEKFAELIVKECIDICKERHWTWRWDETTSGPNECAELIKKHFGVEE